MFNGINSLLHCFTVDLFWQVFGVLFGIFLTRKVDKEMGGGVAGSASSVGSRGTMASRSAFGSSASMSGASLGSTASMA